MFSNKCTTIVRARQDEAFSSGKHVMLTLGPKFEVNVHVMSQGFLASRVRTTVW